MFAPGKIIAGRYRLIRLLGEGGMGAVWEAKNEAIARDVAIKVMRPAIAGDPVALQRFFTEAQICGSIRNPGIVDVLDLGRAEDGSPFLVMELLEGESLEARISRERRLLPSVILPIVRDVARTIALAHEKGVIHRDLKPANLFLHLISPSRTVVKVLDFGISKVSTPGASIKTTASGAVIGSPPYMSPEHLLGRVAVDLRTDIYALGVILYEALSGRLPFQEENYNTLIISIVTSDPPDIATLIPDLPPHIAALVRGAMAKDRDKRIATMNELADQIEKLLPGVADDDRSVLAGMAERQEDEAKGIPRAAVSDDVVSTQTASAATTIIVPPKRRWLPVSLGIAGIVAGTAGLVVVLRGSGPERPSAGKELTAGTSASVTATLSAPAPSSAAPPIVEPIPSASAGPAPPSSSQTGQRPPGPRGAGLKKKDGGAWGYD